MLVHRYSEMPTRLILPAPRHILFIWLRVLGISEDFFFGGSSRGARLVDLVISNGGPDRNGLHESILRRGR